MEYKWRTKTGRENLENYLDNSTTGYILYSGIKGSYKGYYKQSKINYI